MARFHAGELNSMGGLLLKNSDAMTRFADQAGKFAELATRKARCHGPSIFRNNRQLGRAPLLLRQGNQHSLQCLSGSPSLRRYKEVMPNYADLKRIADSEEQERTINKLLRLRASCKTFLTREVEFV
jgi:hypothetical protein